MTDTITGGDAAVDMNFAPDAEAWQLAHDREKARADAAIALCDQFKERCDVYLQRCQELRADLDEERKQHGETGRQLKGQMSEAAHAHSATTEAKERAQFWRGVAMGLDPQRAAAAQIARQTQAEDHMRRGVVGGMEIAMMKMREVGF